MIEQALEVILKQFSQTKDVNQAIEDILFVCERYFGKVKK